MRQLLKRVVVIFIILCISINSVSAAVLPQQDGVLGESEATTETAVTQQQTPVQENGGNTVEEPAAPPADEPVVPPSQEGKTPSDGPALPPDQEGKKPEDKQPAQLTEDQAVAAVAVIKDMLRQLIGGLPAERLGISTYSRIDSAEQELDEETEADQWSTLAREMLVLYQSLTPGQQEMYFTAEERSQILDVQLMANQTNGRIRIYVPNPLTLNKNQPINNAVLKALGVRVECDFLISGWTDVTLDSTITIKNDNDLIQDLPPGSYKNVKVTADFFYLGKNSVAVMTNVTLLGTDVVLNMDSNGQSYMAISKILDVSADKSVNNKANLIIRQGENIPGLSAFYADGSQRNPLDVTTTIIESYGTASLAGQVFNSSVHIGRFKVKHTATHGGVSASMIRNIIVQPQHSPIDVEEGIRNLRGSTLLTDFFKNPTGEAPNTISGNTLTITQKGWQSKIMQTGAIASKQRVDFSRPFVLRSRINLANAPDGISIVFHNDPREATNANNTQCVGGKGHGLGSFINESDSPQNKYIEKGIAIEHDNSRNTHLGNESGMDSAVLFDGDYDACSPSINHVSILDNTNYSYSGSNHMPYADFEYLGQPHSITSFLYWNPDTKTLIYEFDDKQLSYIFDPVQKFGSERMAYLAYTGAANYSTNQPTWQGNNSVEFIFFDYIDYSADTQLYLDKIGSSDITLQPNAVTDSGVDTRSYSRQTAAGQTLAVRYTLQNTSITQERFKIWPDLPVGYTISNIKINGSTAASINNIELLLGAGATATITFDAAVTPSAQNPLDIVMNARNVRGIVNVYRDKVTLPIGQYRITADDTCVFAGEEGSLGDSYLNTLIRAELNGENIPIASKDLTYTRGQVSGGVMPIGVTGTVTINNVRVIVNTTISVKIISPVISATDGTGNSLVNNAIFLGDRLSLSVNGDSCNHSGDFAYQWFKKSGEQWSGIGSTKTISQDITSTETYKYKVVVTHTRADGTSISKELLLDINVLSGSITVDIVIDNTPVTLHPAAFFVSLDGGGRSLNRMAAFDQNSAKTQTVRFDNLPMGTYSLDELLPARFKCLNTRIQNIAINSATPQQSYTFNNQLALRNYFSGGSAK